MTKREMRAICSEFKTREATGDSNPCIEGYFSVFDSDYIIEPGLTESVDRRAFDDTLAGDVRALINHNSTLVLGRTKAHTLELKTDSHGLWGRIDINPKDVDAMNLYERVKRGDVDQCSFGFEITSEESEIRDDDSIHWTITGVKLYEVSVCTFPAYDETSVNARGAEAKGILEKRKADAWKARTIKKIKGE